MTRRTGIRTLTLVAVALLAALSLIGASTSASSTLHSSPAAALAPDAPPPSPSPRISYQGRLVNPATGEPKRDDRYSAIFELYSVDAGGTPLWSEKQPIVTSKGLFTVLLGNDPLNPIDPALFDGYGRWLSVSIDPDGELLPRVRVAHAPYAIYATLAGTAANADRLGGNLPSAFAVAGHTHDAAAITLGTLAYDRFNAYGDLVNDARIGPASGMVAAGLHDHRGTDIVDGSIGPADLAANSVDSAKIVDLSVGSADLASGAVNLAKMSGTGATTNDVMQYDGTKVTWDYAPGSELRFTALPVNCASVASFTTTYAKIADIGTVSKLDATSRLDFTFNGRVYAASVTGTGAVFELRVDNSATTNGRARASFRAAEVGSSGVPVSITGIFTGLAAGTHTVSMWVAAAFGSGTSGGVDPGCWATDHIVVREIK